MSQESLVKAVLRAIKNEPLWKYMEQQMDDQSDNGLGFEEPGLVDEDQLDLDGLGMDREDEEPLDYEPDEEDDEVGMGGPQYADHGREPAVNMERTRYSRASRYQPRSYSKAQLDQVVNHALARGVSFEVARNELEYY